MTLAAPEVTTPWPGIKTPLDPITKLYELLLPLETVQALYADWHPDGLDVWIVTHRAEEADREQIYDREWALMQAFPGLGLDVSLIDQAEIDLADAVNLERVDLFLRFPRISHA